MMTVHAVVKVSEEACIGCKACDNVCPTAAIVTVDRLARVDESKCTACMKCVTACFPHNAIAPTLRETPLVLGVSETEYAEPSVREEVEALCNSAGIPAKTKVCFCLASTAAEAAAAIVVKGARTLDEICLQTGIRGTCGTYCLSPLERLLDAAGHPPIPEPGQKHWRNYYGAAGRIGLWNVPESAAKRWPEYYIAEDQQRLKTETIHNPIFADIAAGAGSRTEEQA